MPAEPVVPASQVKDPTPVAAPRHLVLLGSTGSIGRQTLEVLRCIPGMLLVGVAARSDATGVIQQAVAWGATRVALHDLGAADEAAARADIGLLDDVRGAGSNLRVYAGDGGVAELIRDAADAARAEGATLTVLNGIVGAAGLRATLSALECGAVLALANKESMVAGGPFVLAAARAAGTRIIPVDSEHSALFQCLRTGASEGAVGGPSPVTGPEEAVEELLLTGSGGPFRTASDDELARVTPEQALAHPTWAMGPKISVDSATLMNKGLEVIEAHYLFRVPYERITVLLDPRSVVHGMVRFADGAVLAHMGVPDMRVPIAYALGFPTLRPRLPMVRKLDLLATNLAFVTPDMRRFRCLDLAIDAGKKAAAAESAAPEAPRTVAAPIVLNAANEVAVAAFLAGRLGFTAIADVVEKCQAWLGDEPVTSVDDVFACDGEARRFAAEAVGQRC